MEHARRRAVGSPGEVDAPVDASRVRSLVRSQVSNAAVLKDDYLGEYHVYEPHRAGLPPIRPYFRELWRRRAFAVELAKSTIRSTHHDTVFGVLWNVINPLLLAGVYYLLVAIISQATQTSDYFAHLLAGLFAFYFVAVCMSGGSASVTSAG